MRGLESHRFGDRRDHRCGTALYAARVRARRTRDDDHRIIRLGQEHPRWRVHGAPRPRRKHQVGRHLRLVHALPDLWVRGRLSLRAGQRRRLGPLAAHLPDHPVVRREAGDELAGLALPEGVLMVGAPLERGVAGLSAGQRALHTRRSHRWRARKWRRRRAQSLPRSHSCPSAPGAPPGPAPCIVHTSTAFERPPLLLSTVRAGRVSCPAGSQQGGRGPQKSPGRVAQGIGPGRVPYFRTAYEVS